MKQNSGRLRRLLPKLTLAILGIVFGACIAEIALRVAGYSYPEFYALDQTRGYALQPGAQGWYRKEGRAYVQINSAGLRDREHTLAKPANTFRIALVGDSYPEAFAVSLEEAFWFVMRDKLQECDAAAGKRIEVINFGVSGYGTAQELLTVKEKVWQYSPDLVMLAVTTNNDISDNVRELKRVEDIPYFVFQDNRLVLDNSFQTSRSFLSRQARVGRLGRWLRVHSRLAQVITEGHRGLKTVTAAWRARWFESKPAAPGPESKAPQVPQQELGTDNQIYLEPQTEVWKSAWRVTEELLKAMRDEVRSHGAKFVVVTLSNGIQVFPDAGARDIFTRRLGGADLLYPDNRIKSFCDQEQISVITLAPDLQQFADNNRVFLHGFDKNIGNGHWNVTGNRVAGELLAKKICAGALLK